MQNFLYLCARFQNRTLNNALDMDNFKKYLGVILLLLGVICLIVYKYALQANGLLVAGVALEVAGILAYIFINKKG